MYRPYLQVIGESAIKDVRKTGIGILITLTKGADVTRFIRLSIEIKSSDSAPIQTCVASLLLQDAHDNNINFSEAISILREQRIFFIPVELAD